MSQGWTDDVFVGSHDGMTDLQNMENNFLCLKSMFSGLVEPSASYRVVGTPWGDAIKKVLKIYNSDWIGLMHADADQKIWIYRDSAMDGWVVDSTVSDKVVSIYEEGGTVYTVPGSVQGDFKITNANHNHKFVGHDAVGVEQHTFDSSGSQIDPPHTASDGYFIYTGKIPWYWNEAWTWQNWIVGDAYTGGCIFTGDWRPLAATGTLQGLDF